MIQHQPNIFQVIKFKEPMAVVTDFPKGLGTPQHQDTYHGKASAVELPGLVGAMFVLGNPSAPAFPNQVQFLQFTQGMTYFTFGVGSDRKPGSFLIAGVSQGVDRQWILIGRCFLFFRSGHPARGPVSETNRTFVGPLILVCFPS